MEAELILKNFGTELFLTVSRDFQGWGTIMLKTQCKVAKVFSEIHNALYPDDFSQTKIRQIAEPTQLP